MTKEKKYQSVLDKYLNNNLFSKEYLLSEKFLAKFEEDIEEKFEEVKRLYGNIIPEISKEANLEIEFIEPVFKILNYASNYETTRKFSGKIFELDYLLFDTEESKQEFREQQAANESSLLNVLVLAESKAFAKPLDTLKIDRENNPHFQLVEYLKYSNHNYGFLSNGNEWRLYDLSDNPSSKVFCEINLKRIIEDDSLEGFNYFYHIFKKQNFLPKEAEKIKEENEQSKKAVEENLKDIIYGDNSIVYQIGSKIYQKNPNATTKEIFKNTVTLTFRLIFIAYFEDKFHEILFKESQHYKKYSLKSLMEDLKKESEKGFTDSYYMNENLIELFELLDKGNVNRRIPLLNGGLFNEDKASLISNNLFNNKELYSILKDLLLSKTTDDYRDFRTLSTKHLGSIYEALLEFDFKIALDTTYYIKVKSKFKIEEEGYFDGYDIDELKKEYKGKDVRTINTYQKGEIYLSSSSHSRKSTASYYTPEPFTKFMVKEAIDQQMSRGLSVLDLRIIDNACGSGHFLVQSLNYITELGLKQYYKEQEEGGSELTNLIVVEKEKIEQNIKKYNIDMQIDEFDILKRILLKKVIFGVDLNEFSIELTRLILWLETFIYSTPLSFIEHHIKQGNALIGSTVEEFRKLIPSSKNSQQGDLLYFNSSVLKQIEDLKEKLKELDSISDTTQEEIEASKQKYKELQPVIEELNILLNFTTYDKFSKALKKKFKYRKPNIDALNQDNVIEAIKNSLEYEDIKEMQKLYSFFNYEIEFAEVFNKSNSGFNVIVGNPPWDKVEFTEPDFFNQYRFFGKNFSIFKKEKIKNNLFSYPGIKEEYDYQKENIHTFNSFYKEFYPKNTGSDGNIYRVFIEKNLSLMCKEGSLCYLTPSEIIYSNSSFSLRKHIFNNFNMKFFYQFENKGLFKDIHKSYKFAVFLIQNNSNRNKYINVKFMQKGYSSLNHENTIKYPYELIKSISPEQNALLEVRSIKDFELIRKLYSQFKLIDETFFDIRVEFTEKVKRILKEENKEEYLGLYEGKMIHQFDSLFSGPQYYIDIKELEEQQKLKELELIVKSIYKQLPESIIKFKKLKSKEQVVLEYTQHQSKESLENIITYDYNHYKLVIRDVTANTNQRSIISCLLPIKNFCGATLRVSQSKRYILKDNKIIQEVIPIKRLLFLNSIFNSFVVDYLIRFMVDTHVTKTYLMLLPIPQPEDQELDKNSAYKLLYMNALKLTLAYNFEGFKELAEEFNIKKEDLPKTEKEIDLLKIQNDIEVAKIYDITYEEFEHLTSEDYFSAFHNKQKGYINLLLSKAKDELPA